jgi:hypothetical protein
MIIPTLGILLEYCFTSPWLKDTPQVHRVTIPFADSIHMIKHDVTTANSNISCILAGLSAAGK